MDVNVHNQSYWFALREDQGSVVFTSNNFTTQNPQIAETHYVVDTTDNRQYIQLSEHHVENSLENIEKDTSTLPKDEDSVWDKNKIKILLSLCLENRFQNSHLNVKETSLWNKIGLVLSIAPDECSKKYRNLRKTYIRLLKKKRLGKEVKWVYYGICEEIFKDCKTLETWEDCKVRRLLSLYIENLNRFRNPDCLQKDIWKEIAAALDTTEYNCYHKFKNLKRTYFNWLERNQESNKIVKWPYHHYFERIFYNYNPIRPWDRNKIKQLLEAYAQIAHKFRNPKFRKKELWRDISNLLGETPGNCDRKFRNLKQTYVKFKMRADTGRKVTKWRYFKDFELIYNNPSPINDDDTIQQQYSFQSQEDYIRRLLTFYIENKEKFRNPLIKKKCLWRTIGPKLGLTSEECSKKFRNLKQTYLRLAEKKEQSGKCNNWPYFDYFERIYDEPKPMTSRDCNHKMAFDDFTLTEIKKIVHNAQERKDNDKKFEVLVRVAEESNDIQRERNRILQALLDKKTT